VKKGKNTTTTTLPPPSTASSLDGVLGGRREEESWRGQGAGGECFFIFSIVQFVQTLSYIQNLCFYNE